MNRISFLNRDYAFKGLLAVMNIMIYLVRAKSQLYRKSCDKTVSQHGKDLLSFCKVYSVVYMNDRCGNDLKGSFTYISQQGCSLIDYILCSPDLLVVTLCFGF